MTLHDAWARRTPWELAFGDPEAADELVRRVEEEAGARGADVDDPTSFMTVGAVADFVRRLQGPDMPPEAAHAFGTLVYHGFHFARAGRPLWLLDAATARYLVEGAPTGQPTSPGAAGYLQLPQHLFWAESDPSAAPESVDGLFWTATSRGTLHTLLAVGMRPDRPGLAAVPLPSVPLADAPQWLGADVRADGPDFASDLPGGELDRLYAFQAAGEVLKFLARFFAHVEAAPGAAEERDAHAAGAVEGGVEGQEQGPAPSALAYRRVSLDG